MLATTISPSVVVSVFSFVVSFVDSFGLWNNNKYKLEIYYYSPREVMLILINYFNAISIKRLFNNARNLRLPKKLPKKLKVPIIFLMVFYTYIIIFYFVLRNYYI